MIPPEVSQQIEDAAAVSLGFAAALFVTEPETWPVFERWLVTQRPGALDGISRQKMRALVDNLADRIPNPADLP